MTTTMSELNRKAASRSDRERFRDILAVQRAAHLRDGAPSLTKRRSDLKKFKAAMLARRSAIEDAISTDFGHRARHETAIRDILGVVQGIDYLARNLRRFMRPSCTSRKTICPSAGSVQSGWAHTMESKPSARSAMPRAYSSRAVGVSSSSCVRPSEAVRILS
jgi:acyl-CoA reductase-like NAD-dependent aldehyde dehydrogenase